MPVVAPDASAATLSAARDHADRRAEDAEGEWRRLALSLFAFEAATIAAALSRARTPEQVTAVLAAARRAYEAPHGLFYQAWRDRARAVLDGQMRDAAREVANATRDTGTAGNSPRPAALPPAAQRIADERAESLAREACATTQSRVAAVERAATFVRDDARAGGGSVPPGGAPPSSGTPAVPLSPDDVWAQRRATLEPLVGKEAAAEIIATVRDARARGQGAAVIAKRLAAEVHATEVTRTRATRIARTESVGAMAAGSHAQALASGVVRVKRWLDQKDERVRDSHRRCAAQGWIPVDQPFSNGLQFPGERPAPPEEVINCRCACAYADQPL